MANKKSSTRYFIIGGFVVLIAILGYLFWQFNEQKKQNEEITKAMNYQRESLTKQLEDMNVKYDSLRTDNDSINVRLESEQARIQQLLAIKASNAMKIRIYEKELVTLRVVMQGYVRQIDSLNTMNIALREENVRVKSQIDREQKESEILAEKNENLETQVKEASVLKAKRIDIEPLTKSSKVTAKLKKVTKIKTCFTLSENILADKGPRMLYIRIARPDELVLVKTSQNLFDFEGEDIGFSANREVEYEGNELDICIYYDVDEGELIPGTYYVDVFTEGKEIGTSSFSIK